MTPPPMERQRLTGAVRGRVQMFSRKLVMQVEVQVETAPFTFEIPPPPDCADRALWRAKEEDRIAASWRPARVFWRDATWQDQLRLALQGRPKA